MSSDLGAVGKYWSEKIETHAGKDYGLFWWNAGPDIFAYRNSRISGDPNTNWIQFTLNTFFDDKLPLANCLSLGCGGGRLERRLAELGAFEHCDAYDAAEGAIRQACELAEKRGFTQICYQVADINIIELPEGAYDAVWITMALHHLQALEHVCEQIAHSLKPDGLFILNEYIGPNRFQFPPRQKEVANLCLRLLPVEYRASVKAAKGKAVMMPRRRGVRWSMKRLVDKVQDGDLLGAVQRRVSTNRAKRQGRLVEKSAVNFPSVRDVVAADPSESVRSEEIVGVVQQYFEIVLRRDWGGNLLQFLLQDIAGNFSADDPRARAFLKMLINIEETFLECGEFQSDFAYMVARPR